MCIGVFDISISHIDYPYILTLFENINIDKDILKNIAIDNYIDEDILTDIDIDEGISENINIYNMIKYRRFSKYQFF